MASAIRAHNLDALHAERAVRMPRHGARQRVEEGRPAAAGLELVVRAVQRRVAARAGVDAGRGHVLVVFADIGRFGALLTQDAELLWRER